MPHRDIVVIGASSGGLTAVNDILTALPADLDASLFVVLHLRAEGGAHLPAALARNTRWDVAYAIDGERIRHRRVFVAPPDYHLLIKPGRLRVVRGPHENRFRPAVDPLFRSAAESYGRRVIGIVLSGAMGDGTHGLDLIKRQGGVAVVQDPQEAISPGMPLSAIQNVEVDHILRLADVAARLRALVEEPLDMPSKPRATQAPDVAEGGASLRDGVLTDFTCPECGGSLRQLEGGRLVRFRCNVGHGYTAESLLADQRIALDNTFWNAVRALEELSMLRRRMSELALDAGRRREARAHERDAREAERRASDIRRILQLQPPPSTTELGTTDGARRRRTKPARARNARRVNR